jgi:Sortase domain
VWPSSLLPALEHLLTVSRELARIEAAPGPLWTLAVPDRLTAAFERDARAGARAQAVALDDAGQKPAQVHARDDYAVTDTQVVHARDLAILGDTGEPQLTLVTCCPFDAIAPGRPLRYVVRAARVRPALRARATGAVRGPARVPSRLPRA